MNEHAAIHFAERIRRSAFTSFFVFAILIIPIGGSRLQAQSGGFVEERRIKGISGVEAWPHPDHLVIRMGSSVGLLDLREPKIVWETKRKGILAVDPAGKYLVFSENAGVTVLNLADGKEIGSSPPPAKYNNYPTALAISPDGKTLAIAVGSDWRIDFHELPSGMPLNTIRTEDRVQSPDFSPDGRTLAFSITGPKGGIYLHRLSSGDSEKLVSRDPVDPWGLVDLKYSPDGRLLAGLHSDSFLGNARIWIWNSRSGQVNQEIKAPVVKSLQFASHGKWVAADGTWPLRPDNQYAAIGIWDPANGVQTATITDLREGNGTGIPPFAFSPDGRRIAAGFSNVPGNVLLIWRWDPAGSPLSGIVNAENETPPADLNPSTSPEAPAPGPNSPVPAENPAKLLSDAQTLNNSKKGKPVIRHRKAAAKLVTILKNHPESKEAPEAAKHLEEMIQLHPRNKSVANSRGALKEWRAKHP